MKETGQPYEDVGRIRIVDTRNKTAIAQVEYACDGVNPGDTVVPFAEKPSIPFHPPARFDRFLPASNKLSGRVVMGKDFDSEMGTGQKLYINVGANQGVKVATISGPCAPTKPICAIRSTVSHSKRRLPKTRRRRHPPWIRRCSPREMVQSFTCAIFRGALWLKS